MNKNGLGALLLGASLLCLGSHPAAEAQIVAETCYEVPVRADCAGPLLDRLLDRLSEQDPQDRDHLTAALADKLINNGFLDSALKVALTIDRRPLKETKLAVLGVMQANVREYAVARDVADLIEDMQPKRAVLTAIIQRFVTDGEVEPAWLLVKEIDDAQLSDEFHAGLVGQFAVEERFGLAWDNAKQIGDSTIRNNAYFGLALAQVRSQPLEDVQRSLMAIDDPAARARDFATVGLQAHHREKEESADRLFELAQKTLAEVEVERERNRDSLLRNIALTLQSAGRLDAALKVAGDIGYPDQKLVTLGQLAGAFADQGATDRAREVFQANLDEAAGIDDLFRRSYMMRLQAEFMMMAGLVEDALAVVDRVAGDSLEHADDVRLAVGRTALMEGRFDLAEQIMTDIQEVERARLIGLSWIAFNGALYGDEARAKRLADTIQMSLEIDEVEDLPEILRELLKVRQELGQFEKAADLADWLKGHDSYFRELTLLGEAAAREGSAEVAMEALEKRLEIADSGDDHLTYGRVARTAQTVAKGQALPGEQTPEDILALSKRLTDPNRVQLFVNVAAISLAERGRIADAQKLVKLADNPELSAEFELPELAALLIESLQAE